MKRLEIIRVDPNTGYVVRYDRDFNRVKMTEILPYRSCMAYVMENQEEGTIYKIGVIGTRKNARRKYVGRILAEDDAEAVSIFEKEWASFHEGTVQLLTGDWKIIAQRNADGTTIIF
jgi:hypothetical protein